MIKCGKDGSVCLFWNDLYIASLPLGYKQYNDYKKMSDNLIIDGMKDHGADLKKQIRAYRIFCDAVYKRKEQNKRIDSHNMLLFCACCLALVKLKFIEEEDVVLIMPKKKPKKISSSNNGRRRL
tara:strand:- start:3103 stop:3474 length:372 start_codon:yes stop_codon:yes gene_type:complete